MAPKVTSSSNRSKRSTKKPVTGTKPSSRANRQSTSTARVTQSGGARSGGARVTNASQRTSGSARVTGTPRPALPPGRSGGALVRQGNAKPENPRRTSARNRQATAGRGTTGPGRVGQPAGSANRMFGANRVNQAVNRAVTATRLGSLVKGVGRLAVPVAIGSQLADIKGGFEELANHPFMKKLGKGTPTGTQSGRTGRGGTTADRAKPKPKPNMNRPGLRYEKTFDTQAPRSAYGLKDKPPVKPVVKPVAKPTSASTSTRSRPTASAPARTPSRPAASRPSAPKPPSASSAPKVAGTSGIGPVKSGAEYAKNIKKQPETGKSFAGSKDMSASEMATSYNTNTNYGSRVNTAFSAESPSAKPSTSKKKSSALSQAEIRKRRLNR